MKNKGSKQTVLDLLKKIAKGEEFDFRVEDGGRFQVRNGRLYHEGLPQKWWIYQEWLNKEATVIKKADFEADSEDKTKAKDIIEALSELVDVLEEIEK